MLIHEVIEKTRKARTKAQKIEILRENESWALKDVLRGTYDSRVQWNIPSGAPPYTPADTHNVPSNLLRQNRQFRYFVKGLVGDEMLKAKREKLYIQLLESIDPNDAELVVQMVSKKSISGVTKNVIKEAFPGLLTDA